MASPRIALRPDSELSKSLGFDYAKLPSYGLIYFDHLVGEYEVLSSRENIDPVAKERAHELAEVYLKGSRGLTWGDLCAFEGFLLSFCTAPELRERLWALESRYEALASGSDYQEHSKLVPLDLQTASEELLRARVTALLGELYRLYMVTACREAMRNRASARLSIAMVAFLVLFFAPQLISNLFSRDVHFFAAGVTTVTAVLFAGAMGGFISSQRRLQGVAKRGESMIDLIELSSETGYWLSPITGAVFAGVLYVMIAGGFLNGGLFPQISTPLDKNPTGLMFAAFAQGTGPSTGLDWAKLLIWCFIAGFAERFVPDALDRVVARSQQKATTSD